VTNLGLAVAVTNLETRLPEFTPSFQAHSDSFESFVVLVNDS
jgi:hypothetical protein